MFFICDKYMGLVGVAVHELFVFCLLSPYGDNREGRERVKICNVTKSAPYKSIFYFSFHPLYD